MENLNLLWDENFLIEILKDPFKNVFQYKSKNNEEEELVYKNELTIDENIDQHRQPESILESKESLEENEAEISEILYKDELQIIEQFQKPIEIVLRTHVTTSTDILSIIYRLKKDLHYEEIIEKYGSDLIDKLESIRRYYRLFVEAATDTFLQSEAKKLVNRFFGENYSENHLKFIKLKRFFEKLKSFHEISKKLWDDIGNLISSFYFMKETKVYFEGIQEGYLPKIQILIHQTNQFLSILSNYLKISEINYNPNNLSYTINLTYDNNTEYTIDELYAFLKKPISTVPKVKITKKEDNQPVISDETKSFTIVVDSQIKKFQRDYITVHILGSKDWNRTKDYYFELSKNEYLMSLKNFYDSLYVILDYTLYEQTFLSINTENKPKSKEEYDNLFSNYVILLQQNFIDLYKDILKKEYPAIPYNQVFIYHLGAKAFYEILVDRLKEKKIGEIIYMKNEKIQREYPLGIIKKTLIDWWNQFSSSLDNESIDSYVIYMQQIEYLRNIFLKSFGKILNTNFNYHSFQNLSFAEIEKRNMGLINYYVFKRFFPNLTSPLYTFR